MFESSSGIYAGRLSVNPVYSFASVRNILSNTFKVKRPESNKNAGALSDKSVSKMKRAFAWLSFFAEEKTVYQRKKKQSFKFKINFMTVTLSKKQKHSDEFILHHMLFPLMKWMERKHNCTAWIWRAEIQPSRLKNRKERCIHFHITTDTFIHWRELRNKWNALQLAHGYRNKNSNPNSTDVKAVIQDREIANYMAKYVSKKVKSKELKVNCKIWGCSRNLSSASICLREEEVPGYGDIIEDFLTQHTTGKHKTDYGMIYEHNLTTEQFLPEQLKVLFEANRTAFAKGKEKQLYYEVE